MDYTTTITIPSSQADPALPIVHDLVQEDWTRRREYGLAKYGVPMRPFDGNDSLREAYQEALDLVLYLRAALYERDRV